MSEVATDVRLLVRLGHNAGGRVNPNCILSRRPTSRAREAFMEAQDVGWLDGSGWVTEAGRAALRDWDAADADTTAEPEGR